MQHTVSHEILANGAEGLCIDIPSASVVTIDIAFRAGDYLAPAGKTDTAHIMEHLVLGANKAYPSAREYSREFSKFGAYNNAYTGDYHMGYEAECEASEVVRIIDLVAKAIESPLFNQEDFEAEVGNVREELKMRRNNDDAELALTLEHFMGFVPKNNSQRESELPAITLADIERHYRLTHTTSNMRFVIAGPLKKYRQAILDRLNILDLPKGDGLIELPDEKPRTLTEPLLVINNNLDNLCYRWEVVLPKLHTYQERDSLGLVHDTLFNGLHSRAFGMLREKGLVYSIYDNFYETRNNAVNVIGGQVQANNIAEVFSVIIREWQQVAMQGISGVELDEIKKRAYGEIQRNYQTPSQINNWYRHSFTMRGEVADFMAIQDRLSAITSQTVKDAANLVIQADIDGLAIAHSTTEIIPANELYETLHSKRHIHND